MRALILAALLVACGDRSSETQPIGSAARVDATDLIAKFECARCHEVPGVAPVPVEKACVGCHQQIHAATFAAPPADLARWQKRITSLRWAPSLANADRLRSSWVRGFLLSPHDVRPGLIGEMPRLALSADEATRLASALGSSGDGSIDPVDAALVAKGEQLYRGLACGRCHRFTGARVDDEALHAQGRAGTRVPTTGTTNASTTGTTNASTTGTTNASTTGTTNASTTGTANASSSTLDAAWALAPDLRFARDRMTQRGIANWIAAPRGAMPSLGVSADDARALAAFIATTPLADAPRRAIPARLPILEREVTWDEVSARVFHDKCWHCHAVPDFARGDGGPGNSGGFGFRPRGLDLSSYEGIAGGSLDDAGERRSVFAKLPDGTPRVVAHLMARYAEEAGEKPAVRGMPLGLPPIALEDIQLVETWIAQGRPQ